MEVLPDAAGAEVPDTPLGLYVHVPFCIRRCGYCAFVTYAEGETGDADAHRRWADAAVAEVALADRVLGADRPTLTSVYFGGGTPTSVAPELLGRVLDAVRRRFATDPSVEVTVEANPDGLRPGQLARLRELGVTRVSLGLQSASNRVLELLDRTHPPERAVAAVAEARAAGFDHVSLDLIHGTPGETAAEWDATVALALGTGVDHLSAYALAVEPGTKLAARVRNGELPSPSGDDAADRYAVLDRACRGAGLDWYELSNWAADESARCRHNLLYWRDHHWWGVGPGAHSRIGPLRWWNPAALGSWWDPLDRGRSPAEGHELLGVGERRTERLMLGIRLAEGVEVGDDVDADAVRGAVEDGLAELRAGRLLLTDRGRLLADLVVRRLL
ncbi:MAG: radical SAM family heme chaperone HemW [Microthrixaceae bacterium]